MKKTRNTLLSLFVAMFAVGCGGSSGLEMPVKSTYPIEENDTPEMIIKKAAHVVPTKNQLSALRNEFIAFIHMGPNTFTRMEWGNGMEDPKIFDLKELDTDQWCKAMAEADMKMVVITVKHHDGFVLWQSRYTDHGVMSTGFRDGKGDILKDLSASCQKYGLKLGIYLSPADLYQIENENGLYGNLSEKTTRTIPRQVEGRPFENKTTFTFDEIDDYNEYFLNQLFEVLTEYGPVHEVWFDGAHPKRKGGQTYNYAAWKELIHTLAPEAVIFGREDVRWCGNESGGTRSTEWNVIPYTQNPNTATAFPDMEAQDIGSRNELLNPATKFLHYQQAETNTSIREGWFYRDDTHQKVRSADDVFDIYERSVGGNSTFLLNIPPNREGRFSPQDVEVLQEVGKRIRETYGVNLLANAKGPKAVLDNNQDSFLLLENINDEIVITTPSPITLNRLVLQEAVGTHSERVEKHAVDAWINGEWVEITHATNIGYKRILRFPEVTTDKLRVRVLEVRMAPAISNITAHYYETRPPQLGVTRTVDGMVSIEAVQQDFNWKPHNEDIAANLTAGFKIYYTIGDEAPSANSTEYTGPFKMDSGKINAVAILNDQQGPVMKEQLGFIKGDWKLVNASSEAKHGAAKNAFDENAYSAWRTTGTTANSSITIDLGKNQTINGFAYTPSKNYTTSMMSKGVIKVSDNGRTWKTVENFDLGNLINDPSKRHQYFKTPAQGRYVKVDITETADKGKVVTVGELDFF